MTDARAEGIARDDYDRETARPSLTNTGVTTRLSDTRVPKKKRPHARASFDRRVNADLRTHTRTKTPFLRPPRARRKIALPSADRKTELTCHPEPQPPCPHASVLPSVSIDKTRHLFSRLESRSLSELTRQIAPPTKNGHAPPPTESRKSSQSVNPSSVRAW